MDAAFRRISPTLAVLWLLSNAEVCLADVGPCSGGATNIVFGSLSLPSLQNATTVAATSLSCPAGVTATKTWDVCSSIGVGANSVSQTDRRMTSGSNYISYQLYTDSGYSNPYQYTGSNLSAVTYNASSGLSVSVSNYAKILSSGASIPPGTYTDSYTTGAQAVIASDGYPSGTVAAECTGDISSSHWWNTTAFTVSVTLQPSCSVSASPLNFGTAGPLTANIDAATSLSITCTYTTPYSVALSAGNAPGATTSTRAMTNGSAEVYYSLYQNAARTLNWGSNLGVDTVAGTGTGSSQNLAVYGRTPPQTTPAAGDYSDAIIVTVNY